MSAAEIIEEIKQLPVHEQACVAEFVASLNVKRGWTPEDFTEAAEQFVAEPDPATAEEIKKRILTAFYEE